MNQLSLRYLLAIANHCFFHRGTGFARGAEQSFNKSPGLLSIKLNLMALIDDSPSHFTRVRNDEFSHRAPLNGGGLLKELFVRRRHTSGKPPGFLLLYYFLHTPSVCPHGTHFKR